MAVLLLDRGTGLTAIAPRGPVRVIALAVGAGQRARAGTSPT
jgi:hypothetical protein